MIIGGRRKVGQQSKTSLTFPQENVSISAVLGCWELSLVSLTVMYWYDNSTTEEN